MNLIAHDGSRVLGFPEDFPAASPVVADDDLYTLVRSRIDNPKALANLSIEIGPDGIARQKRGAGPVGVVRVQAARRDQRLVQVAAERAARVAGR